MATQSSSVDDHPLLNWNTGVVTLAQTPTKTSIAPENGWLEDDISLQNRTFSGDMNFFEEVSKMSRETMAHIKNHQEFEV